MAKPAAKITIKGLKCDADGCGFIDPDAPCDESQVGRACPKCGASLLTDADMANVRLLQFVASALNAEVGPVADEAQYVMLHWRTDGSGNLKILKIEEEE